MSTLFFSLICISSQIFHNISSSIIVSQLLDKNSSTIIVTSSKPRFPIVLNDSSALVRLSLSLNEKPFQKHSLSFVLRNMIRLVLSFLIFWKPDTSSGMM